MQRLLSDYSTRLVNVISGSQSFRRTVARMAQSQKRAISSCPRFQDGADGGWAGYGPLWTGSPFHL